MTGARIRAWRVGALLLAAAPAVAPAQTRRAPLAGLENYVTAAMRQWNVPGLAVAVVKGDSVVYARGFGVRELGRPDPVDEHTLFAVASNTKALTATVIGTLVAERRIAWDDRVETYLPGFAVYDPWVTHELTVRDLLSHRSGLGTWVGDLLWYGSDLPLDSVLAGVRHVPNASSFRSRYGYSNLMFVAAGRLAERVSGRSWEQLVRERLTDPLGMRRATFSVRALASADNVATPHAVIEGRLAPVPYRPVDNAAPAAALNASVREWAQWLRLQLGWGAVDGRRIVDSAVVAATRLPSTLLPPYGSWAPFFPTTHFRAYGLGWFLMDFRGRLVVLHDGGMDGMYSQTGFLPEERLAVAVFTNRDEHELHTALFWHIVELYLGRPSRDWSATLLREAQREAAEQHATPRRQGTTPRLPLADYAGRYANEVLGEVTIRAENGRLVVRFPHHPGLAATLAHWEHDVFQARWADRYFRTSLLSFDTMAGSALEFRVTIRPDFVDPLEYRFRRVGPVAP